MPIAGQIRLCENVPSQIRRLPDTTCCLQIAVQPIQVNQQDTVVLGEGAEDVNDLALSLSPVVYISN